MGNSQSNPNGTNPAASGSTTSLSRTRSQTQSLGRQSPQRVPSDPASNASPTSGGSAARNIHVSSLFGGSGGRDRSSSVTSSLGGRPKSNSISSPTTPPGLIDGGHLHPQGLYSLRPSAQDYSHQVVKNLIIEKKLAPFYRGLEDYEEDWEEEEVITALKEVRASQAAQAQAEAAEIAAGTVDGELGTGPVAAGGASGASGSGGLSLKKGLKIVAGGSGRDKERVGEKERERREARAYKGAVECPICFLYYPANINTSRCCEQPLCSECFVQIKRAEATITHLESEPAACPYCMETDFGVIYEVQRIARPDTLLATSAQSSDEVIDPRNGSSTSRRKSVSHKSKEVVTIDQIRPDWEDKLNAVKAQAARRASRRIIMHRVGDRLIPVGYTSSRTPQGEGSGPITTEMTQEAFEQFMAGGGIAAAAGRNRSGSTARRSRRTEGADVSDLEEMMIMEAMRLSMLDQEEQQRKAAEEKKKKNGGGSTPNNASGEGSSSGAGPSTPSHSGFARLFHGHGHSSSSSPSSSRPTSTFNSVSAPTAPSSTAPANPSPFNPATHSGAASTVGSASGTRRGSGSPLAGTPITAGGSGAERPDLINLDSDALVPTVNTARQQQR